MNPRTHNKIFLILAQIGILGLSMVAVFWLMVIGNKERIENDLKTRLDASTQTMAAQLKANQVPFSATSVDPGVFIINQTDGSVVIDRRNDGEAGRKLWEGYKTKIIYEMQKQKRGWVEYPDKNSWNFNEPRRIIRYVSIDELNWILALEDLKPSAIDLIKASVNPATCLTILFIFILGAAALWLLTKHFFDLIKRQISNSLEDNLLSLNGEEKFWGKSHAQMPKMNETNKETGLEFSAPKTIASNVTPDPIADPIMEEIFHKSSSAKTARSPRSHPKTSDEEPRLEPDGFQQGETTKRSRSTTVRRIDAGESHQGKPNSVAGFGMASKHNADLPVEEKPKKRAKEIPQIPPARSAENTDMAVDVQHINSPVLKKILQQFREK